MPSTSYRRWTTSRARALDEIARAHTAVGGTRRGRRYSTQQVNRAYAVLLASEFQGFCRDLHTECVNHVLLALAPPPALELMIQAELTRGRQLDRGNAHPASLGADFGRLGISFWVEVESSNPRNKARRHALDLLNNWRNAIVHQDFDPGKLGGTTLGLAQVQQWRVACQRLARAFDGVMYRYLRGLTGVSPW